jgi:4-coumarate--CoA ligase
MSAPELEYQLRDSGAKILLTTVEGADVALKAAAKASLATSQVYVFGDLGENQPISHLRPWTDLWCSPEEASSWSWKRITTLEEAASTTAVINYSSG